MTMQFHIEHITDTVRREVEARFPEPVTCSISDAIRQCFQVFKDLDLRLPVLYIEPPVVKHDPFEPDHITDARRSGFAMVHVRGGGQKEHCPRMEIATYFYG